MVLQLCPRYDNTRICAAVVGYTKSWSSVGRRTQSRVVGSCSVLLVERQTAKANCGPKRKMDVMKTLGSVILLFALQLSADAQIDVQNSTITFYTTDMAGVAGPEILYSYGQKIGEVIKGQCLRLSVSPGTYQFALTEDAPPAEQLSVSVGDGQKTFLRVTRTAFFNGRAAEANASPRAVNP